MRWTGVSAAGLPREYASRAATVTVHAPSDKPGTLIEVGPVKAVPLSGEQYSEVTPSWVTDAQN